MSGWIQWYMVLVLVNDSGIRAPGGRFPHPFCSSIENFTF